MIEDYSKIKGTNIDTYNRTDEPQKNYAVQKKKQKKTKEYILCDCHLCEILE